jgi:hypothetical protein
MADRRSPLDRTAGVPPYRFGLPGPPAGRPALADLVSASRARLCRSGAAKCGVAWVCSDPARCYFFLGNSVTFFF